MAFNFNGITPKKILFNGLNVAKMIFNNVIVWTEKVLTTITGYPITLTNSTGEDLVDYTIYGNSIQDGTPTKDTPIEIQSVGTKTKNLLDNRSLLIDYHYHTNGNLTKNVGRIATPKINVDDIDTITIQYSRNYTVQLAFVAWDVNGNMLERNVAKAHYNKTSVTIDVTDCYQIAFFWWYVNTTIVDGDIYDVMVCEGSEVLDYEPYGYKIPVKVKKPIEYQLNTDDLQGYYSGYGTFTSNTGWYSRIIDVNEGDIINISKSIASTGAYIVGLLDNVYVKKLGTLTALGTEFTIPSGINQINISTRSTGLAIIYTKLQVSSTNIYLNEPLRKFGDYTDYIDFANQKVVRKNIAMVFNETTQLNGGGEVSEGSGIYRYYITKSDFLKQNNTPGGLCSHLPKTTSYNSTVESIKYGWSNQVAYIFLSYATLAECQSFFAEQIINGTPFEIMLPRAENLEEDIDLPVISTKEGENIIEIDTEIEPSDMKVEYYKKGA